jgi:hypothetical protein
LFPFIFDITSSSSSYHHEKLNSSDLGTNNTSTSAAGKKIGPSYNKRTILMPDDELLSMTPESSEFGDIGVSRRGNREHTTKVWIKPGFGGEGSVAESLGPIADRHTSQPSTKTSLWALEGPMISDADGGGSVEDATRNIEMGNIEVAVSEGGPVAKEEYRTPRSQRVWASKSLPPLPAGGRLEDWV